MAKQMAVALAGYGLGPSYFAVGRADQKQPLSNALSDDISDFFILLPHDSFWPTASDSRRAPRTRRYCRDSFYVKLCKKNVAGYWSMAICSLSCSLQALCRGLRLCLRSLAVCLRCFLSGATSCVKRHRLNVGGIIT